MSELLSESFPLDNKDGIYGVQFAWISIGGRVATLPT